LLAASLILLIASFKVDSDEAYEIRIHLGDPKALPGTVATSSYSNNYSQKSAAYGIIEPLGAFLPK
jgi:hypothetical protein